MASRNQIVILEDDHRRRVEMFRCIDVSFAKYQIRFFRTSQDMQEWLNSNWDSILFASLDHDLEDVVLDDSRKIPAGTGREAADALVAFGATRSHFPVLIHSTNVAASHGMLEGLREANWMVERIAPYSDLEWIEQDWLATLKRMLNKPSSSSP